MKNIIEVFGSAPVRLVVSAITVESVAEALDAMKEFGFEGIEIVQTAVARSKKSRQQTSYDGNEPHYHSIRRTKMKTAVIALTKNGCKTAMLLHRELEKKAKYLSF